MGIMDLIAILPDIYPDGEINRSTQILGHFNSIKIHSGMQVCLRAAPPHPTGWGNEASACPDQVIHL